MISVCKMAESFHSSAQNELFLSRSVACQLVKWKVAVNQKVSKGSILAVFKKIPGELSERSEIVVLPKLKSQVGGVVKRLLVSEGGNVKAGEAVILLDVCEHKTVMKEMCAECGADLRQEPGIPGQLKEPVSASVALVHNIPELRVSQQEAEILARKDKDTLLRNGKLVLLVDLDQTLIHTTTENVPPDMKNVYHFQLPGQNCWYHTKFRPGWEKFLKDMSKCYELHIFTMGSRLYAHTIARMLDPSCVLFADRIRSRDESFDMFSKYRDLRALFPCDDSMVCIIDDREDIWDCAPNLVTVKPYRFFSGTGDINAPSGSEQTFTHPPAIPLHEDVSEVNENTDGREIVKEDESRIFVDDGGCKSPPDVSLKNTSDTSQTTALNSCKSSCITFALNGFEKSPAFENIESNSEGSEANSGKDKDVYEVNHDRKESASCEKTFEGKHEGEGEADWTGHREEGLTNTIHNVGQNSSKQDEGWSISNEKKEEDAIDGTHEGNAFDGENEGDAVDGNNVEDHVEDHDDYLLYLEEILRRIHASFYEVVAWNKRAEMNDMDLSARVAPDLRHIVPESRRNVLKGTNVVFTGVIPTNTRPEESQPWKVAQQFGAGVSRELLTPKNCGDRKRRTTHVIAARPGTEKACHALRLPWVRLVNPNWLWTCVERWEWVDERLFPLEDYHEHKIRRSDTPTEGTPEGDNYWKKNKGKSVEKLVEDITDDNLKIVLNPFLNFSSGEMAAMDKEVEDLMKSSDEEDENEGILGSVSSSSNSTEDGDSFPKKDHPEPGQDLVDGGRQQEGAKGKVVNFSTIKQNRHEGGGSPSKRRKLDFRGNDEEEDSEFSTDLGSSGSNSGDDNDMAALLEAELFN